MPKVSICHISFNHSPFDDRIYWKELLSLNEAGYIATHIAAADNDADYISKEGIRIIIVKRRKKHQNKWVNKFIQLILRKNTTITHIYEKAKSVNAQVYHYHDLQLNVLSKKLKNLPQSPKVIYDAHEAFHLLMLEDKPTNILKIFFHFLYIQFVQVWELFYSSFCDYIIATDEYTLMYFKKKLPNVKSIIVFNYSYFDVNPLLVKNKNFDFIYAGLMTPNRGIENIIKSIALLKQKLKNIKLLLIGPFEDELFEKYIKVRIQELNIVENIHIEPPVPFTRIPEYYAQSKIGLGLFNATPKYTTFIPIKLFEYMAFGLPVIFSKHSPPSKIVKDTKCGLLVEYTDTEMICSVMLQLLSDNNLYNELSKNGMNAVKNEFNWAKEQFKLLNVYDILLNTPS